MMMILPPIMATMPRMMDINMVGYITDDMRDEWHNAGEAGWNDRMAGRPYNPRHNVHVYTQGWDDAERCIISTKPIAPRGG